MYVHPDCPASLDQVVIELGQTSAKVLIETFHICPFSGQNTKTGPVLLQQD